MTWPWPQRAACRKRRPAALGAVGLPALLAQGLRCRRRPGGAACIHARRLAYDGVMGKRKDPAAVKLGRRGGLKRMAMLTPQQRTDLARRAALKRWRRVKAEQ